MASRMAMAGARFGLHPSGTGERAALPVRNPTPSSEW